MNDSLGHHAGDELLQQLADRLRGCTRETDLVARQGGDEFLLLLADLDRVGQLPEDPAAALVAESVAARSAQALEEPFDLGGVEFFTSASIGVSLFPQDATDATSLLRNADTAMYQSKKMAPGGSIVYASGSDDAIDRLSFTTRLRRAVEQALGAAGSRGRPGRRLGQGRRGVDPLAGSERRDRPARRVHPIAERAGVSRRRSGIRRRRAGATTQGVGSGGDRYPGRLQPVRAPALWSSRAGGEDGSRSCPRPRSTRTPSSSRSPNRRRWPTPTGPSGSCRSLHAWGLSLAVDDFGTGYSSLARLKHLPVDILKIDRSFINDVDRDEDSGRMVEAMVQLARGLSIFLAEGIERGRAGVPPPRRVHARRQNPGRVRFRLRNPPLLARATLPAGRGRLRPRA